MAAGPRAAPRADPDLDHLARSRNTAAGEARRRAVRTRKMRARGPTRRGFHQPRLGPGAERRRRLVEQRRICGSLRRARSSGAGAGRSKAARRARRDRSRSSGSAAMNSSAQAVRAAARTRRRPRRRGVADVLAHAGGEQHVPCSAIATARRRSATRAAQVEVVERDRPRVGVEQAQQQRHDRALARACRANQRRIAPTSAANDTPTSRPVGAIGERHVAKRHFAVKPRQRHGVAGRSPRAAARAPRRCDRGRRRCPAPAPRRARPA